MPHPQVKEHVCKLCRNAMDCDETELYRATGLKWLRVELVSLEQPLTELAIQNHQNTVLPPGIMLDQMDHVLSTLKSLGPNVVHETNDAPPKHEIHVRHS
ncbi:hypothetical protein PDIDSM_7433 [Penicillium digitatum]|nr:hypothetical protein PDIDSM_7433 [Penicillium digitatum]